MNQTTQPTHSAPLDTDRARQLFQQVCSLASTALHVSRLREQGDPDDLHADLQVLRTMVSQMAFLADRGDRALGGEGAFESAEDWLLLA